MATASSSGCRSDTLTSGLESRSSGARAVEQPSYSLNSWGYFWSHFSHKRLALTSSSQESGKPESDTVPTAFPAKEMGRRLRRGQEHQRENEGGDACKPQKDGVAGHEGPAVSLAEENMESLQASSMTGQRSCWRRPTETQTALERSPTNDEGRKRRQLQGCVGSREDTSSSSCKDTSGMAAGVGPGESPRERIISSGEGGRCGVQRLGNAGTTVQTADLGS